MPAGQGEGGCRQAFHISPLPKTSLFTMLVQGVRLATAYQ
ncbi:hypothetical protein LBMAG21_07620 [Armatimonadota bacterium]|nr:hypothetical protein LBMAG21_07620 [Armatimonadota bacterium]